MTEILQAIALWLGISLVAVFMFALGAALGRRGAWEDGYRCGLQASRPAADSRRPVRS